jgi:hypothetical protein
VGLVLGSIVADGETVGVAVGVGEGVAVGIAIGVGLGDEVGAVPWHAAAAETSRKIASTDPRIDRPITTPRICFANAMSIITHRSLIDAKGRRNVSVARLPLAESL